jgi:hypothetical protein
MWRESLANARYNVIVDSDIGGDMDDLEDLANVVAYHKQGLINFIGYSLTGFGDVAPFGTACARFSQIPNLQVWGYVGTGGYCVTALGLYSGAGSLPAPSSYLGHPAGFRKCLAAAPNNSVILAMVAPGGDIVTLLQSSADIYSPLAGPALVAQKVRFGINAAGVFPSGGYEYNFGGTNWATLFSLWPSSVPFIFSGIEQSAGVGTVAPVITTSYLNNPYACCWSTNGFMSETGYSFPGLYWAFGDVTQGAIFTPGGLKGTVTVTDGVPSDGDSWAQIPAGPYGYLTGISTPNAVLATLRRSSLVAQALNITVGNDPPINQTAPAVTGSAQVGQTVTCSQGIWFNAISFTYQWIWGDTSAVISGATSSTYTPVTGDVGHTLKCTETATGHGGVVSVTTAATAAVITAYTLTGSVVLNPTGPANLTTLGTTDWIAFGYSSTTSVDRKSSGGSVLGAISGVTSPSHNNQGSTGLTWTDGTPDGSVTDELYYAYSDGESIEFTAPAGLTPHTLYVYVGQYNCPTSFTAHLSDGSSPDYTSAASTGGGWNAAVFVLTYHAASNGQTLTISFGSTNSQPAYIAGAALQ